MGGFSEFTPYSKAGREVFAIKCSTQQMPLEREILTSRPEAPQEFLRAVQAAKTGRATLALARGLVAILRPVV